jgi:probable rRNA maturation factor
VTPSRSRAIRVPPWRVDLTAEPGVPRLVPGTALARTLAAALSAAGSPGPASVGLILSDDAHLAVLNEEHLGVTGPTDVLSFPLLPPSAFPDHPRGTEPVAGGTRSEPFALPPRTRLHLGDIVVSVERAIAQAEGGTGGQTGDVRWSPADELRLLVTHGALHLCGWDHAEPVEEAAMRAFERDLLEQGPAMGR